MLSENPLGTDPPNWLNSGAPMLGYSPCARNCDSTIADLPGNQFCNSSSRSAWNSFATVNGGDLR